MLSRHSHRHWLLAFLAAVLALSCAKVGRPPGGMVDKEAPVIVGTWPRADEINVGLGRSIEVEFSEGMDGRRSEDAVFVSPGEMRARWRGRRLEIKPVGGLQPDRTYVITIGTDARDLRGNKLDQSFTFAFATGGQLDRGSIAGRVLKEGKAAGSANVWAYHTRGVFDSNVGVDPPAYATQSGRDGGYDFQRLAPGTYRILAFDDDDGDGLYDKNELLGLSSGDVTLAQAAEARMGDLNLIVHGETPVPELKRVQSLHDRVIMLSFADPIEDTQELVVEIPGLPLEGMQPSVKDRSRWYLSTPQQEGGKPYSLTVTVDGNPVAGVDEPVTGSNRADRKPPTLEISNPAGELAVEVDSVSLSFSEAMDTAYPSSGGDLWVRSDSTVSPEGRWDWDSPATLVFSPTAPLGPGAYRLQVALTGLRDRAGLAPVDSTTTLEFEVLPADELSSIAGAVIDAADSNAVQARVVLQRAGSAGVVTWVNSDSQGRYFIKGLAPGQYDVRCIDDLDGDGVADGGRLSPYAPAESYQSYPRSISLGRDEQIDGIDFELR